MAILFGTTSKDTDANRKQYAALEARAGDQQYFFKQGDWQAGVGVASWDKQQAAGSGYHEADGIVLLVAGAPLDSDLQLLSPQKLWERFKSGGIKALTLLHGAFVIAVLEGDDLLLVRDAAGQRTIYYSLQKREFSFAVETKGITAIPGFQSAINQVGLYQYLTYSFVPLDQTMIQGVKELAAGHYLHYNSKTKVLKLVDYFPLAAIQKHENEDPDYWKKRIRTEVDESIVQKLSGQEEVGVFLSGGLDSSIIAARVAQLHHRKIHTFSINFGPKYPNENHYARLVAERYQTIHHEVTINPKQFRRRLEEIIYALDEPSGDPITAPNFELARYASGKVGCIFNGEGGDPCFGGPKNIGMLLQHWYGQIPTLSEQASAYLGSYRRGYRHLQRLLHPDLWAQLREEEHLHAPLLPFISQTDQPFLDRLMGINIKLKGAHLILPKVERMLGANGFVPYAPLFSRKIIQSSMEMPTKLKLRAGVEKFILKEAFAADVPTPILRRPKSGMRVPVRYWFRGELRRKAKKMLSRKAVAKAGLFQPDAIRQLLAYDKETGLDRHGLLLWMILTLELWRRQLLDEE